MCGEIVTNKVMAIGLIIIGACDILLCGLILAPSISKGCSMTFTCKKITWKKTRRCIEEILYFLWYWDAKPLDAHDFEHEDDFEVNNDQHFVDVPDVHVCTTELEERQQARERKAYSELSTLTETSHKSFKPVTYSLSEGDNNATVPWNEVTHVWIPGDHLIIKMIKQNASHFVYTDLQSLNLDNPQRSKTKYMPISKLTVDVIILRINELKCKYENVIKNHVPIAKIPTQKV